MKIERVMEAQKSLEGAAGESRSVQAAIDRVFEDGGGMVVVPSGMRITTGTITLRSRVELHLERGAVIEASLDPGHYPNGTMPALIEAHDAEDVSVTGPGTVEGRATEFMVKDLGYIYEPAAFRPRLLCFYDCRNVRLEDVTFHDSPFWTVHLVGCSNVDIARITIDNNLAIPNCDGIDPDHCRDVTIRDSHITCADDAIVLKNGGSTIDRGPTENVYVSGCTLMCTAGAIKIGTGTASDFRNLFFSNCTIRSSSRGLSIQHRDQGDIENVQFSGFQIETRLFEHHYWGHAEPIHISAVSRTFRQTDGRTMPYNPESKLGRIRGVKFSDIEARSEGGIVFYGSPDSMIEDVSLRGIDLRLEKWSKWPGGYLDIRPVDSRGSDVFVDPENDPGRIPGPITALQAHCVDGLIVDSLTLRVGTPAPEYYTGPVQLSNAHNVSMNGFLAR